MRGLYCSSVDSLSGLSVRDLPDPVPGPGQIVVTVSTASVDYADTLIATGRYQIKVPPPFVPGNNFAGTVTETAPDVTAVAVGDRVHGMALVGAFAEKVAVDQHAVRCTPIGLSDELACLSGSGYRTAYDALVSTAFVERGENVVILGASGAVGSAAITIAKALGARVIACASTQDKLDFCRELGADVGVLYTGADFKDNLKTHCGGAADVVLDMVGGDYSEPALRATGYGGRFVVVGFAAGTVPRIPLNLVLLKGSTVKGYEIASFERHHPVQTRANREALERMLLDGRLTPPITARYDLDDAVDAVASVAGRDKFGVTVLQVTPRAQHSDNEPKELR
ncbi:NADPH:quinone oxidoreductase family protein [Mycolicibacterium gadium]|uniref:NADPH:quinone oxidoreductase family protein n=1 Tax=Mycolicibacterium gadium TaxID=1794 RepID=A0ABT6GWE7_MYCGU|nr:NADPH:quinone oxidoreductase family protein [Mycolicibacterium gadium]MDG5485492.1 NADPH:quinone oxidoreductase family protein [Mycolicibacterium gadium]